MLLEVLVDARWSRLKHITCLQSSLEGSTAADSSDERIEGDDADAHGSRTAVVGCQPSVMASLELVDVTYPS